MVWSRILENTTTKSGNAWNIYQERQCLEHFRFPEIFLRKTKKAYISFVTPEIVQNMKSHATHIQSYNAIRLACRRKGINMDMRYCRKLHGSWLHKEGIPSEIVDFLQGRVSTSVFSRHYLTPQKNLKDKVLDVLDKLQKEIDS
jgi:intergrase/recombinase